MASIIISGEAIEDTPELNKMINGLLKGKIGISQFIKFLDENNLETKVRSINGDINSSVLADLVDEALSTLSISIPKNSEYEEDNIEYAKALELFHSLMHLRRTYHQRAIKGDEKYHIPNFTPEDILRFIDSLNLPTDKIRASLERGKSTYYKTKNYKDFKDFEKNMKYAYGIENVWNPSKETPEWFESIRDNTYRQFHEEFEVDGEEWDEFKKWKEEKKDKEDIDAKANKLFRDILNIKPDLDVHELIGINELAMKGCVKGLEECLECLKKSKKSSIVTNILKYSVNPSDNKKSSTSKKTSSSTSAKDDKPAEKKTSKKSTTKAKTDSDVDLAKQYSQYAGFILTHAKYNSKDAKEALLLKAKNLDTTCEKLYVKLNTLIAEGKENINLIYYFDEENNRSMLDLVADPLN